MIEINNLTTVQIDEEFLKKVAEKVLKEESPVVEKQGAKRPPETEGVWSGGRGISKEENKIWIGLSIALVGQGRMRELNKKYKKKNRVTDVLAFPGNGLGEIVICLREVKKNAKRFSSRFEKELATCLIHGILHLLGYDHEKSEKEAKKMREKEEHYLSQLVDEADASSSPFANARVTN